MTRLTCTGYTSTDSLVQECPAFLFVGPNEEFLHMWRYGIRLIMCKQVTSNVTSKYDKRVWDFWRNLASCSGWLGRTYKTTICRHFDQWNNELETVSVMANTTAWTQDWRHTGDFTHTHTHTHPFNGPLSGTTQVSRYQKGKTNLDFTGARDSEWQWHQLGHIQVCTSLQTDNHASTPPHSFFTGQMPFLPPNQQRQSTEGKIALNTKYWRLYRIYIISVINSSTMSIPQWCCQTYRHRRWYRSRQDKPPWSSAGLCRRQTLSAGSPCACSGQSENCPDCPTPRCGCPYSGWLRCSLECAEINNSK